MRYIVTVLWVYEDSPRRVTAESKVCAKVSKLKRSLWPIQKYRHTTYLFLEEATPQHWDHGEIYRSGNGPKRHVKMEALIFLRFDYIDPLSLIICKETTSSLMFTKNYSFDKCSHMSILIFILHFACWNSNNLNSLAVLSFPHFIFFILGSRAVGAEEFVDFIDLLSNLHA